MDKSTSVHLDEDDQIICRHQVSEDCPNGYPVLDITARKSTVNSLTIWPGMDRLRRLYVVIGAYLAAHDGAEVPELPAHPQLRNPRHPQPADVGNCEPGTGAPVVAEAAKWAKSLRDELMEIAEDFGRGMSEPWPPDAAKDKDASFAASMSLNFEPRMPDEDDPTPSEIAAGTRNAPKDGF